MKRIPYIITKPWLYSTLSDLNATRSVLHRRRQTIKAYQRDSGAPASPQRKPLTSQLRGKHTKTTN